MTNKFKDILRGVGYFIFLSSLVFMYWLAMVIFYG